MQNKKQEVTLKQEFLMILLVRNIDFMVAEYI